MALVEPQAEAEVVKIWLVPSVPISGPFLVQLLHRAPCKC